jgi:SAM-dependent methyltransferase
MSDEPQQTPSSAVIQSRLWGTRPQDWAEIEDEGSRQLFEAVFDAVKIGAGTRLLDVGCGSGLACEIASALGADVSGLDATPELLEIARQRVPRADFRRGDMQSLPHDANSFDVVTYLNCLFLAADQEAALREARRVARPGGKVAVVIWGEPDRVDATAFLSAVGSLMPPGTPEIVGLFYEPGALEDLARRAGLEPERGLDIDCPWLYPNLETLQRGWLSAGPAAAAVLHSGEDAVKDAIARTVEPFGSTDGGFRLNNVFRCLIAAA